MDQEASRPPALSRESHGWPPWRPGDLELTSLLSLRSKSSDLSEKQMARGERERTGLASGSPTGPISSGQKLWRRRQVRGPPLPRPTHGHPAAPFPDTAAPGPGLCWSSLGWCQAAGALPTLWEDAIHSRKQGSRSRPHFHPLSTSCSREQPTSLQAHNNGSRREKATSGGGHTGVDPDLLSLGQTSGGGCWRDGRRGGHRSHHSGKRLTNQTHG